MRRALLTLALTFGLVSVTGCFNRSTEPQKKLDEGGNMDRLKNMGKGANPKGKDKVSKGPAKDKGGDKATEKDKDQ